MSDSAIGVGTVVLFKVNPKKGAAYDVETTVIEFKQNLARVTVSGYKVWVPLDKLHRKQEPKKDADAG